MIIFSRHARHQMKWRCITEEEVITVISRPDSETPSVIRSCEPMGEERIRATQSNYIAFK